MMSARWIFALAACAAACAPATAVAAPWQQDRSFGQHGRAQWSGDLWEAPVAAAPGGRGRTLIVDDAGAVLRLTAGGRLDRGWGRGGAVQVGGAWPWEVAITRWGGRVLASQFPRDAEFYDFNGGWDGSPAPVARVLDDRGRDTGAGAALRAAMVADGDQAGHVFVPTSSRRLLQITRLRHDAIARQRSSSGAELTRRDVAWPLPAGRESGPVAPPIVSGGAVYLTVRNSRTEQASLVKLRADGSVDRSWGNGGAVRAPRYSVATLPWRGGAIVVAGTRTWWISAGGRVVAKRAIRASAAAVDRYGRLLLARGGNDYRHTSVLRLRRDRRVDRSFGRLTLRASGRARPEALVVQPDGRVVVVGVRMRYQTVSDLREDYTELVARGTVAWRLRAGR